jgi:hypothetical protein
MIANDYIMKFSIRENRPFGLYRIRFYISAKKHDVVVISEIGDLNPGTSVTNSIEHLIRQLKAESRINDLTIVIEHCEPSFVFDHTYDIITLDEHGLPIWKNIDLEEACGICETDAADLTSVIKDNNQLLTEIEILNPVKEEAEPESSDNSVTKISKSYLQRKIGSRAGERELQWLLQTDLSILGEIYSDPKDEYICFSEFPVGDKPADFVLFTGRSKMVVYIIEIKGADFYFSNKGTYKKMNEKISKCRHQIVEKLNHINKSYYSEFHQICHNARQTVESGNNIYNAQVGKQKYLQVDERKEIEVYGVIIGGVTRDDLHESKLRYNEQILTPIIRIESWNSFINKLSR